ncbi:phytoene desaturase family protein [Paenibacillus glycanilyticus]|uniref:phytoene desaturase family protein n=1 Tax=Paenibacillus glycanilyticus TaxID=126569 RepID=UPI003EBD8D2C
MKTAIVGGGIGGIVTALLLARKGMEVEIYEKSGKLGGRLAYQEGGGYRIDQGPTIVLLPEMLLEILAECGVERDALELLPCDPMYAIHYGDGTVFRKWKDTDAQLAEISVTFPGEEEGFKDYIRDMSRIFTEGKRAFLEKAFLRKRHFLTIGNLQLLSKLGAFRSVRGLSGRYFHSEQLKDAFSLQTLYIGGSPSRVPGIYTLLPYAEHAFGVWYLKGGYARLVEVLERELRKQGITVHLEQPVSQLHIEESVCKGLVTQGELKRYDAVVYNGDFPNIRELYPDNLTAAKKKAGGLMGKKYVPSSGCMLIYMGLNRQWPCSHVHQFYLPASLTDSLKEIFEEHRIPKDPSFYVFNPSRIDEQAAPPGKSVLYMLVPVPSDEYIDWSKAAEPLKERVMQEAERRGFPGLQDSVEWLELRTPADARRDGLYGGGSFGIAPILNQSGLFRPQIVPDTIAGLYAVGASLHPGGGIPIVMQGARLAANHIEKEMKVHGASTDIGAMRAINPR